MWALLTTRVIIDPTGNTLGHHIKAAEVLKEERVDLILATGAMVAAISCAGKAEGMPRGRHQSLNQSCQSRSQIWMGGTLGCPWRMEDEAGGGMQTDKKKPCPPSIPRPSCLVRPQRTKKKSLTLVFFFVPFTLAGKKYENLLTMICVKRLWTAVATWQVRVRERAESITIRSEASCGPC